MQRKNSSCENGRFMRFVFFPCFEEQSHVLLRKVVGQLGMWGVLINGIQAAALEHNGMKTASWNGTTSEIKICLNTCPTSQNSSSYHSWSSGSIHGWCVPSQPESICPLICFLAMIILYTVAPLLYRMASSTYYNLSLLSSDFFGLLFGASS
jgi:solute carrier family 35, member F1/2